MEYRELGKTGLKVSVVGLGTLGFERGGLFKKGDTGLEEIAKIVNRALDLGINFIDTAASYGNGAAEEGVGKVVKTRRKDCIILSRANIWYKSDNPKDFTQALDESLRRLNTDVIDIYQLHSVDSQDSYQKVMKKGMYRALKKAKEKGKVKFIGLSTHGTTEDMKEMITSGEVDVITVAYNLIHQRENTRVGEVQSETSQEIFPLAQEFNVGLTTMKAFAGGLLLSPNVQGKRLSQQKVLKYVVQNPYVDVVAPGVDNLEQLEEIIKAGDPNFRLSKEEIRELEEESKIWGKDVCRQCGYCLPCSAEIPIPKVMKTLMHWRIQDEKTKKQRREAYQKMEINVSACTGCKECEERCPYNLRISEWMKEAQEIFGRNA